MNAAVCDPSEPSTKALECRRSRATSSPCPRAATVSRSRSHAEIGTAAVDARRHPAAVMRALEHSEILPRAHVRDRCHALRRDVMHRRVERAIVHLRRRIGHRDEHDVLRVVLEYSRRLARRVAHDRAAGDVGQSRRRPSRRASAALFARIMWPSSLDDRDGIVAASPSLSRRVSAARRPKAGDPNRRP